MQMCGWLNRNSLSRFLASGVSNRGLVWKALHCSEINTVTYFFFLMACCKAYADSLVDSKFSKKNPCLFLFTVCKFGFKLWKHNAFLVYKLLAPPGELSCVEIKINILLFISLWQFIASTEITRCPTASCFRGFAFGVNIGGGVANYWTAQKQI